MKPYGKMIFLQTEKEKTNMVQKKILASTLMALILTSQLMGCGSDAAPQKEPMEPTVSTEIQTTEVQMDDVEPTVETVEEATEPTLTRPVNKEDEATEKAEENAKKEKEAFEKEMEAFDKEIEELENSGEIEDSEDSLVSKSQADQIKWMYENGYLTEAEYKMLLDEVVNESSNKQESIIVSEPTHVPGILPEGATYADPSKDGNYQFGEGGELPEHLKGKWL